MGNPPSPIWEFWPDFPLFFWPSQLGSRVKIRLWECNDPPPPLHIGENSQMIPLYFKSVPNSIYLSCLRSCNTWAMGGVLGREVTNAGERQCRILFNWDTLLLQGWNVFELLNRILSFLDTAMGVPVAKQTHHLRFTFWGESQSSFLSLFFVSSLLYLPLSIFC